ncbi:uncharacterized protein LOC116853468, partial [Odontomachus brunneus]|uniref:uncharacterized protein LOC116853468 n=1 Tax=Odontomachus brunneus TaxID=486640 RepID=UPI0013F1BFFB
SLLMRIEEFVKVSKDWEKIILQKYVDRYITFVSIVVISFVMAGITVIIAPLFLPLEFPVEVWYPFSTQTLLRKYIIYVMEMFVIAHTVLCLGVDIMIAVLLFYPTARIEMLALEIQGATDESDVVSCVKKHQEIIGSGVFCKEQ